MLRDSQELPPVDEVVDELDQLARISSVEAYYQADLPLLHAIALAVAPRPDDRSGRYASLRDALERAFERIGDDSYRDAAEALLGYADRWRSVESRSTDAGRAFTPSVSYDAFRRKTGRNYRENTLRATADALLSLLEEPAPAATEATAATEHTPATVHRGAEQAPAQSEPTGDVGRQRLTVVLAVIAAGMALLAIAVWRLDGESSPAATSAPVPVFVVTPTPVTEPATTATDTVMNDAEQQAADGAVADDVLQEIDITRQCRRQGDPTAAIAERNVDAEGGWLCLSDVDDWVEPPDIEAACRDQYGPSATARYADGWTCDIPGDLLHRPANQPTPSTCLYPVGSYDEKALDLNRYSTRFVQAFAGAGLVDGVCASGPMHYYDELPVGGVTQLLALEGNPFGAILADDPANVVVVTGQLWTHYEAVRGLPLYRLGIPIIEDRVGYPAGQIRSHNGTYRLDLTSGGALVSADEDGPFVWMPSISVALWEQLGGADGCLGLPTRPPPTQLGSPATQQFEHGSVSLDPATSAITFDPPELCA